MYLPLIFWFHSDYFDSRDNLNKVPLAICRKQYNCLEMNFTKYISKFQNRFHDKINIQFYMDSFKYIDNKKKKLLILFLRKIMIH